jgi:hypothetical protein
MKKNYFLTILSLLFCFALQAQVTYSGNGNGGFGDVFGSSGNIEINDDGTTISFTLNRGVGDLNNTMVIYIDSKSGGFSDTSTFTDSGDGLRRGISGFDGTNRSTVNFPAGFGADYVISFDQNFAGFWILDNVSNFTFIDSANLSPTGTANNATYSFDVDFTELGITSTDNFKFVATYLNDSNAFRSDEAIGDGIAGGNPGATAITFTGDRSYPNTWTGTTDNDWATATNWTEGVPSITDNVFIAKVTNQPTASSAVTVNKAIIKSGASLVSQSTFNGTITSERNILNTNWYLISSPVVGQDIDTFAAAEGLAVGSTPITNRGLGDYNNSTPGWEYYQVGATGTGNFISGDARAIKLATAGDIAFTGTMPDTNASIAINSNTNGFNLIGNPYTSYLALNINASAPDDLLEQNSSSLTETTAWLFNQATGSYDEVNSATPAFYLAPGQGFFVSSNGNKTFLFGNAQKSHQNADSFQKTATTRPEINLVVNNGTVTRDTDIFYIDGTTTGFDNGYDSSIFGGNFSENKLTVYTHEVTNGNGKKLGIQSLPNSDLETMVIPVGIIAEANKEITFSANVANLPAGLKVFLEDRNTNTFTRLDELNSKYKVTLTEAANEIGRFYLHTKSSALSTETVPLENVSIYNADKSTLRIVGLSQGKSTIKMFNVLGKQVLNATFNSNGVSEINVSQLSTGVYIVQLENEAGSLNKKIVLE